jgi:hypothetical protein
MALIRRGIELTDLSQSGPYHMHSLLSVRDQLLNKQIDGVEDDYWRSAKEVRSELRLKDYYSESAFLVDGQLYRLRRPSFTPPAARQDIATDLRYLPAAMEDIVVRVFDRQVDGNATHCVLLRKPFALPSNWCFDATSGLPLVEYFENYDHRIEFRGYRQFGSKYVPGTVEMFQRGSLIGRAVIDRVEAGLPDDPKLFKPPAGLEGQPWCYDMRFVQWLSNPRPDIPQGMRSHSGLQLIYEVTVDARGNVSNVVPMAEKPFADRIVMETLATWKFKPASCGGTPVPFDMMMNFQN